jgi:hypothetical protein
MPLFESAHRIGFEYRLDEESWRLHDFWIDVAVADKFGRDNFLLPANADPKNLPWLHRRNLIHAIEAHGLGGCQSEVLGKDFVRFEIDVEEPKERVTLKRLL